MSADVMKGSGGGPVLQAVDVVREYALAGVPVQAVRGVSLEVGEGEYAAIVGPSGCGKSTLLNLLGAIDRPTRGAVRLRGRDVSYMSDREATEFLPAADQLVLNWIVSAFGAFAQEDACSHLNKLLLMVSHELS